MPCNMPEVFQGEKGIRFSYATTDYRRAVWKDRDGYCWTSSEEQVRKQVCSSSP